MKKRSHPKKMNIRWGISTRTVASMAKISANEDMCEVIDTAIQILGGYGYMEEYNLEAAYRDIRGNTFGDGTLQLLRNRIAIELLKGRYS